MLQIVTSGGVVTICDPTELVVVKTTGLDKVEVGCAVIVSHFEDVAGMTVTRDR